MDPIEPAINGQTQSTFTRPSDPSKYIRTFAKDVARLTNTPAPAPIPRPEPDTEIVRKESADQAIETASLEQHVPDNTLDLDTFSLHTASEQSDAENSASQEPLAMDTSIESRRENLQNAVDADGTQVIVPAVDNEREAILKRLRARLTGDREQNERAGEAQHTAPIFSLESTFNQTEPQKAATSVPPEETAPPAPVSLPTPSPLHTYSSDFTDRINTQKSSAISVLAAESDAAKPIQTVSGKKISRAPLFAGLAMVVIGAGAVTAGIHYSHHSDPVPVTVTIPSLIPYDQAVSVSGKGAGLMRAIVDVATAQPPQTALSIIYLSTASSSTADEQPESLIRSLSIPAPDILMRNVDDNSTVGVIRAGGDTKPFLILKVSSYERTFAGMLAWEATMSDDLSIFYPPYTVTAVASTSATSTKGLVLSQSQQPEFTDAVVANYDVRILRDASGNSVLLYGYRGKDLLIIARNEAAFSALISRLSSTGK
jgi:hypothetical protein